MKKGRKKSIRGTSSYKKSLIVGPLLAIAFFLASGTVLYLLSIQKGQIVFGATFSPHYAEQLGLDWQEAYTATLDELPLDAIRIPVEWSFVEDQDDQFDFSRIDWMLNEAQVRHVDATLVVGQKVVRWPECYLPDWAEGRSVPERQIELMEYIDTTVKRYRDNPALVRWQVENEPLFPFGECPRIDVDLLEREIAHVRSLDTQHPIQVTTSGEQSFWALHTHDADVLGVSLYRIVKNPELGLWVFPHQPGFYNIQRMLAHLVTDEVVVSELQAEPWGAIELFLAGDFEAASKAFQVTDFEKNLSFAQRTGMKEVHVWGVEWWYMLKQQGYPELWNRAAYYLEAYGKN